MVLGMTEMIHEDESDVQLNGCMNVAYISISIEIKVSMIHHIRTMNFFYSTGPVQTRSNYNLNE